jgi:MraZ protein
MYNINIVVNCGELWLTSPKFIQKTEGGKTMFIGEYFHSFDEKGRVNFPAKLREELGEQFVITKGLDGCLSVYSMSSWEHISELVGSLPRAKARDLKRFMFSAATIVNSDKQGRVLVNLNLRAFANITKDVAVIGASDHVEIWDKETWIERSSQIDSDDIAAIMDELGF